MSELPHGWTEPLRYLAPFPWLPAAGATLALALALAALAWWRSRRRAGAVETSPVPAAPPAAGGPLAALERVRARHLALRSYRRGCHELSTLLRAHLEATRRRPFSRWTAREMGREEGDTVWTRLLAVLAGLQFSRQPPGRSDFDGICELARDVLRTEGR